MAIWDGALKWHLMWVVLFLAHASQFVAPLWLENLGLVILQERVFGLDVVLPKTAGCGRACIWWSPARREAMAELRLC